MHLRARLRRRQHATSYLLHQAVEAGQLAAQVVVDLHEVAVGGLLRRGVRRAVSLVEGGSRRLVPAPCHVVAHRLPTLAIYGGRVRIVSLLPSTTEILFAIGAGDDVVGVTFECDYPAEARTRRTVSTSAMPEGLEPAAIDAFVVTAMARGEDLYHLDEGALAGLDADLVVTQDLCAVCAVDVSVVDDALAHLGCTAEVLTIDPHTLDEVFESILVLGRATGHVEEATALVGSLRARLDAVRARVAGLPRPRVMLLEWTDPPYAPGHWVPEMIEAAGGEALLGRPGAKSERVRWESIHEA